MLASDLNNPEFMGATNPDARLAVKFYSKPIQNMFLTEKEGRPIFEDKIYVEIFTPGDQLNIIDTPVREDHKIRFPLQWAHYQNSHGGDSREIGTPLAQWPLITASQAEELKALKFFTVEQVANASDQQIGNIGMIGGMAWHAFRTRAQAFLLAAKQTALPQDQAAEIEKLRQEQKEKDERHAREMAELRSMIEAKVKPQRSEEEKAAMRARMAKARAARKQSEAVSG